MVLRKILILFGISGLLLMVSACGSDTGPSRGQWDRGFPKKKAKGSAAVPVQVKPVTRRSISQYLETNGILEAEKEVDIVARISGPIVELNVEEGMLVEKDHLLARIDDRDIRTQVDSAKASRDDAQMDFERAQASWDKALISRDEYDEALSKLQSAKAQLESAQIQLDYTQIKAPFSGLIINRYIKFAEHLSNGAQLFRISDFNPLLCPIQVPEKDLAKLKIGQRAHLNVEAFPGEKFSARVLRISPVVDSSTGTVKVTLEVKGLEKLRPGMFASVFLETDTHQDALVISKAALVLDSIGDTVFIKIEDRAARREVRLGFREADSVEVLEGLKEGEPVIVLGQDGLSDGTPVVLLEEGSPAITRKGATVSSDKSSEGTPEAGKKRLPGGKSPEMAEWTKKASPEQLELIKERMRARGLSEKEIEEKLQKGRKGAAGNGQ